MSEKSGEAKEDEATRKDRVGGRQFGVLCMLCGVVGIGCAIAFDLGGAMLSGMIALAAMGVFSYRKPLALMRLFSGMGDKL